MFTGLSKTPRVGLEPTTTRLTAECSTIELSRTILFFPSFSSVCDRDVALPLSYRGPYIQHTFKTTHEESFLSPALSGSGHFPWLCPRPISDGQLHTLLHFHLRPIYLVLFKGSYWIPSMGYLILRGASRLDAFSVYPLPAWLPCYAPGGTADPPAAGPSRSSRTKDSPSQISYARAG